MIDSITDGIISKIRTKYDNSFRIYTDSVEQGLIEPCFSILCLDASGERVVSDRYKRSFLFSITYFPESENEPTSECNKVCENLLGLLTSIDTSIGTIHASDELSGKVIDGVLQFTVSYKPFAILQNDVIDTMDDLSVDTDVEI